MSSCTVDIDLRYTNKDHSATRDEQKNWHFGVAAFGFSHCKRITASSLTNYCHVAILLNYLV